MSKGLNIDFSRLPGIIKPVTIDLITIISKNDNPKLALFEKQMTLDEALNGTTLSRLSKTIDDENLAIILVFLINRLSSNFNVGRKFTDDQAIVMALDLIEVFKYETIEDVLLMFRMARTGRIGDGRDFKLDSQTVFHKWIPQYLEMKVDLRDQLHNRTKNLTFGHEMTIEDVKKAYKKRMSAVKSEEQKDAEIDKLTKGFTRNQLEDLISEWAKDPSKNKMLRHLMKKRNTIKYDSI
jgi:hypothetical protein